MSFNEKEILSMLKFVNESDYGYLNLEDGDFELTVVKKDMDLGDIKDIIGSNNKESENSVATISAPPLSDNTLVNHQKIQEVEAATSHETEQLKTKKSTYTVTAPMVGTFFSRPSPDEDEYVKIWDTVEAGDIVCLIEVMKLFNSVPAGIAGRIEEVLVEDGDLVEYDQPLFVIKEMDNVGSSK